MIDVIEKISTGLCALVVVAVGVFYALGMTPTALPVEFVPEVQDIELTDTVQNSKRVSSAPGMAPVIKAVQDEDQAKVVENLKKQGIKTMNLKRKARLVQPSTFEYVQAEANWMSELKQYSHTKIRGADNGLTRLKVSQITENTMLHKLGFRDGDTIELVDGEIIEWNEQSAMRYRALFTNSLDRLRNGASVSITITRDNAPETLYFSLARLYRNKRGALVPILTILQGG